MTGTRGLSLIFGVALALALPVAESRAAFKGRASPVKPANWVISPGPTATVGGLKIGMTKRQALKAWGRASFCTKKACTWFTKRQRRSLLRGATDIDDYRSGARGDFAHIILKGGAVTNIMLSEENPPNGPLRQFKLAGSIGLHTSYKAMQNVFTLGSCPACPGGPAAVRIDASDRRTFVFYLNASGVYDGGGGILIQRYPPFDPIAFISIGGRASSQEARPG
jgi:hypothetical protein